MKTRTLLHGEKDRITPIPEAGWMEELLASPAHIARRLEFMTPDHRRISNLAVPRIAAGKGPVRVDWLAARLAMTPTEVEAWLDGRPTLWTSGGSSPPGAPERKTQ